MALTSIALGSVTGMVLGLTGAGGGILAVPALVLGVGMTMVQATPVALMAVSAAAIVGALDGLRQGLVRYKAALLMALMGSAVAPFGLWVAHRVPSAWLMTLFSMVMLLVAWRMLRAALGKPNPATTSVCPVKPCMLNPATGKLLWTWRSSSVLAGVGSMAGLLTGMLGVGGGFLIVPAFGRFSNVGMHGVVATSLMVVALVSASSAAGALASGIHVPVEGWFFITAAAAGMLLGRRVAPFMPRKWLQAGFAAITALVSLALMGRAYW